MRYASARVGGTGPQRDRRTMGLFHVLIGLLTNTLATLQTLTATYGVWIYGILFLIIFCETGLVVTPILPGDSLLFALGSFAALGALNIDCLLYTSDAADEED